MSACQEGENESAEEQCDKRECDINEKAPRYDER
jgi:hypothetical protein